MLVAALVDSCGRTVLGDFSIIVRTVAFARPSSFARDHRRRVHARGVLLLEPGHAVSGADRDEQGTNGAEQQAVQRPGICAAKLRLRMWAAGWTSAGQLSVLRARVFFSVRYHGASDDFVLGVSCFDVRYFLFSYQTQERSGLSHATYIVRTLFVELTANPTTILRDFSKRRGLAYTLVTNLVVYWKMDLTIFALMIKNSCQIL